MQKAIPCEVYMYLVLLHLRLYHIAEGVQLLILRATSVFIIPVLVIIPCSGTVRFLSSQEPKCDNSMEGTASGSDGFLSPRESMRDSHVHDSIQVYALRVQHSQFILSLSLLQN